MGSRDSNAAGEYDREETQGPVTWKHLLKSYCCSVGKGWRDLNPGQSALPAPADWSTEKQPSLRWQELAHTIMGAWGKSSFFFFFKAVSSQENKRDRHRRATPLKQLVPGFPAGEGASAGPTGSTPQTQAAEVPGRWLPQADSSLTRPKVWGSQTLVK